MTRDEAAGQILLSGLGDWVSLGEARDYVADDHPGASSPTLREETLTVVGRLLHDGLIVAGDLRPSFERWERTAEQSAVAIRSAWSDADDRLRPGEVCWFANTRAGDEAAERLRTTGGSASAGTAP